MPYITKEARYLITGRCFETRDPAVYPKNIETVGELNYAITFLIDQFIGTNTNYDHINAVVGALECAKLELYRRIAAPYEDTKKKVNGDVYSCLKY